MKKLLFFILLIINVLQINAQLNIQLISQLDYDAHGNDIWGYVANDGTEYALMGLQNGVAIISLANPTNPEEVAFIPGEDSGWRDLKTWNNRAYVTSDQPGTRDGLLIIDLSDLPNSADFINWTPTEASLTGEPSIDTFFTAHNLYIDEFGFCYTSGGNLNDGGIIIFNANTADGIPEFTTYLPNIYSHDVYVHNNFLYASEIFAGEFSVYDVSDKENIILKASEETPFRFTHNAWLSDDGNTLFTTDEKRNAPTAAYDISDLDDVRYLDEFRPAATLNTNVIPHNVHVFNDYLVISHYSDGCVIVDANEPDNLIEVGNYDTFLDDPTGFNGAWGAYPFLPSGLILVSDIQGGLFVLKPEYQRAAYLEGIVTNEVSGLGIQNARIQIQSGNPNFEKTGLVGNYKTGQASAGTFDVRFSALGYFDKIVSTTIETAQTTILNVELTPLPQINLTGKVIDKETGEGIEGATFFLEKDEAKFIVDTDENGDFLLPNVFEDGYQLSIGKWAYQYHTDENFIVSEDPNLVFELSFGYEDNFNLNLGWLEIGTEARGAWTRQIPAEARWEGEVSSPANDTEDFGTRCFLTGNGDPVGRSVDVDGGVAIIKTPPMDLTQYNRPILSYDYWFFNSPLGEHPVNDSFYIKINNGKTEIILDNITESQSQFRNAEFDLVNFIEITDAMEISFHVSDYFFTEEFGDDLVDDVADGALDNFKISEGLTDSDFDLVDENIKFKIYPTPAIGQFFIDYKTQFSVNEIEVQFFNVLGQKVKSQTYFNELDHISVNPELVPGTYFVVLSVDGLESEAVKIILQ